MKKQKVFDPLKEARAKPLAARAITLNPAQARNTGKGEFEPYRRFPDEILACTNLTSLDIFRGIAWDGDNSIPAAIGKLKKLTHLTLGGLTMTELPDAIGKLTNLVELDLFYSDDLAKLPETIGKLTKLRTLSVTSEALKALPRSIGKLKELRELAIGDNVRAISKELWNLTKLESLNLPENVDRLPTGIAKLRKLKKLRISAKALASIVDELALLNVEFLAITGMAKTLPAQIGHMSKLVELDCAFHELTTLPSLAGCVKLEKLSIAGNKLTSVVHLLSELPRLRELSYSENPVPKAERRIVDEALTQAPGKRALGTVPVVATGVKPEQIGKVASINASLTMILGDAGELAAWNGIEGEDENGHSDWQNAMGAISKRDTNIVEYGKSKTAIALHLRIGSGIAEIYRVGERLVVVEGIGEHDEDELYQEWLASPLVRPRDAGTIKLPSKTLAINPSTDSGTKVKVGAGKIARFGDDGSGKAINLGWSAVKLELEARVKSSWGEARRFAIVKA